MDNINNMGNNEIIEDIKNLQLCGTSTRYNMKKVLKIIDIPQKLNTPSTIQNKISSYKQQDKKRKLFIPIKFITVENINKMLIDCDMNCYYCKEKMKIEYSMRREMDQWTLDRIENDKGHNFDNVVIACLKCNLQRRNKRKDLFLMTKQMTINKII